MSGVVRRIRFLTLIGFVIVAFVSLVGCSSTMVKGRKPGLDWSRSLTLGEGVIGSLSLLPREAGESIYLAWPMEDRRGQGIRLVQLNGHGEVISDQAEYYPGQVKSPRLAPAADGGLHLVFARRFPGRRVWGLWYARLDSSGQPQAMAVELTSQDQDVGQFALAEDGAGGFFVAWDQGEPGPIYLLRLDREGLPQSEPWAVTNRGVRPSLAIGEADAAHLAWMEAGKFYYTMVPFLQVEAAQAQLAGGPRAGGVLGATGDTLAGPQIGYAEGWVYLFWSIVSLSDTQAGTAVTQYIAFQSGVHPEVTPEDLWVLSVEEQPYVPYRGSLGLTQVGRPVLLGAAAEAYGRQQTHESEAHGDWVNVVGGASDFMVGAAPATGYQGELAVAMAAKQEQRLDSQMEIVTLLFQDGAYRGYSVASKTGDLSGDPVLTLDQSGNLHIVWREGARRDRVMYATTAPSARQALDRLGSSDLLAFLAQAGMDSFTSVAFLPVIGFFWILPGFLLVGMWDFFANPETASRALAWLVLALAVGLYLGAKIATLPTILSYVPFSAWLPVAPGWEWPLRLGVPVLTLFLAWFGARATRRRLTHSAVAFYLVFALIDAALTLAVYGVNLLGAL